MGQSPSAALIDGRHPDAEAGANDAVTKSLSGDDFCIGCLPAPPRRCFLLPNGWGGRRGPAFEDVAADGGADYEEDGICTGTAAAAVQSLSTPAEEAALELPPEDLVLTDVEDEGEDEGEGDKEERRSRGGRNEGEEDTKSKTTAEDEPSSTLPPIPEDLLSRIVAVDCGMVKLPNPGPRGPRKIIKKRDRVARESGGGGISDMEGLALRRVCVVDGHGRPLLSALVRVANDEESSRQNGGGYHSAVARYLSNLLPRINRCGDDLDVGVPASEVREQAAQTLEGKIVVGHSVDGDLAFLGIGVGGEDDDDDDESCRHRFEVRDTATYPPFQRRNGKSAKLRELVRTRLGRDIQTEGRFHCCEEDAVAALDLYKSVWHEWETSLKSSAAENSREKEGKSSIIKRQLTEQTTTERDISEVQQSRGDSLGKQSSAKTGKNKKKKKRKRKREKARQQMKAKPPSEMIPRTAFSRMSAVLFSPILFPVRISHDLIHLTGQTVVSGLRLARQRCGLAVVPKSVFPNKRQRAKKRRWRARRFRFIGRLFHSSVLLCHCLMEAFVILSLFRCGDMDDAASMHRGNGALAMLLVGMCLLWSRNSANEKFWQRIFYGILAQYHLVGFVIRLITTPSGGGGSEDPCAVVRFADFPSMQDCGLPWVIATIGLDDYAHSLLLGVERVTAALARRMCAMNAGLALPPAALTSGEPPVESIVSRSTGENAGSFLKCLAVLIQSGAAELEHMGCTITMTFRKGEVLMLACNAALFFCFAVRSFAKKF